MCPLAERADEEDELEFDGAEDEARPDEETDGLFVSDLGDCLLCESEEDREEERDEHEGGGRDDDEDDDLIDDDWVADDCGVLLDATLVFLLRKWRERSEEWERAGDCFRSVVFLRAEDCPLRFRDILRFPVLDCL